MDWEIQVKQKADKAWEKILKADIQKISLDNFVFNYRAEHNELVLSIGMEMGKRLNADLEILKAAILLHDIGRSVVKKGHGKVSAEMAGEILENTNFLQEKIIDVKYAITTHVGWDESLPETLEACILWDADKLSKLGASGILHRVMVLPQRGKNCRDAVTKFNDWLKKAEFIKNNMKTELGSQIAEERYKTLKMFVTALNKEMSL
ncbi:MAG: HD domain-containing protein [Calditrichia bacterium]|nr:HD domain-containing protein [Calditrichia bacterium]